MSREERFLWDDRAPSFRLLANGAAYIAKRNGIETDAATFNRWGDAGGLIREVDTLYDDFHVSADEIIERLQDYGEFKKLYPHLGPDELEAEKRSLLFATARRLFHLGAGAALIADPQEWGETRHEEAATTAYLVTDIASDEVLANPRYEPEFVPAMQNFFVGVTFFDSLLDGFIDYRTGKTNVRPNLEYYRTVRSVGRTGMRYTLKLMAHPTIPALVFDMAQQRIRTRLHNGMTDYSTMQNIPDFFRHLTHRERKEL